MINGSIKYKIRLGTLFLFFLVVISGALSIYYLTKFTQQSRNVLKSNYETLQYSHEMQKLLDSIQVNKVKFIDSFEVQMRKQESNVTEPGEKEATANLRSAFEKLKKDSGNARIRSQIRSALHDILYINMNAIKKKNEKSENAAEEAMTFLISIISFIFLIGLTFAYNFPSVITSPIVKLTESIKEIGNKNYKHKFHT